VVDPSGTGVWVQSKFNLNGFLGQRRIRIRWIAATGRPAATRSTARTNVFDDGWWLDNIDHHRRRSLAVADFSRT